MEDQRDTESVSRAGYEMTPVGPLPSHLLPPSSDACLGVMNDLAEWECQREAELSCYIYMRNPVSCPFTQHL